MIEVMVILMDDTPLNLGTTEEQQRCQLGAWIGDSGELLHTRIGQGQSQSI